MDSGVTSERLVVLPQGIDLTRFKLRKRNKNEEVKTILYVGRLEPMKGLEDAVRAFSFVNERHGELAFIICGDGSFKQRLVSRYGRSNGIEFLGHVPHDELPAIYRTADILILPSYSEGLPNVVLEAMASGVAVIASDVGDNSVLLNGGRRGILTEPGNSDQISSAIMQYIKDPPFFHRCIREARRYVEKGHSFDVLRGRYLELFQSVVKE
jgi:glycosyltransferase involved in cell wall biosynthesis